MNGWVMLYISAALINATVMVWLFYYRDINSNPPTRKIGRKLEKITLGDLVSGVFCFLLAAFFFPLAVLLCINLCWEEFKMSDFVLWERKPKDDIADLEKKAKKMGFSLTPKIIKGVDDV